MTTVRSSPASRRTWALLAMTAVAFCARVSAHRLDEVLQAARIAIERDHVQLEMNLTPGVAVAEGIIHGIDADRNGVLSREEEQVYAARVLSAMILSVDDSPPLRMTLSASSFPDVAVLRGGDGAIVIRSDVDVSDLPVGPHRLVFHNKNAVDDSVYLANALMPRDDDVALTGLQRSWDQREFTIEFVVRDASPTGSRLVWVGLAGVFILAAPLARRKRSSRPDHHRISPSG